MKYLAAFLSIVIPALHLLTPTAAPDVRYADRPELVQPGPAPREYMDFVCGVRGLDCSSLPAPVVRYDILPRGVLGMFQLARPRAVTLDVTLVVQPAFAEAILVHEISHYVDFHLRLSMDVCVTEGEAWRVYNAWVIAAQLPDYMQVYDWYEAYPCTVADAR